MFSFTQLSYSNVMKLWKLKHWWKIKLSENEFKVNKINHCKTFFLMLTSLWHVLRYGYDLSDINWDLGHFSKFIFIWFKTLFLIYTFMRNPKMLSKIQGSDGKRLFFEDFWCHLCFSDLEYHVVWRSCTVWVHHILPVKNCEVLVSLKACYNNSKGRILKKSLWYRTNMTSAGPWGNIHQPRKFNEVQWKNNYCVPNKSG